MALPQPSLAQLRPALKLALDTAASGGPGRALPGRVRDLVRSRRLPASWAVTMVQALEDDEAFRAWVAEEASEESLDRVAWLWLTRPEGWAEELAGLVERDAAIEELEKTVRLASERADSLERELAGARDELARVRAAQSSLAFDAEEQRRAAAQLEAERRAELASALTESRTRVVELETARTELVRERDALAERAQDLEGRLAGSERARLDAETEATRVSDQLESLGEERDALEEESELRRASVAGAVGRAAAAAGELGVALAAAAAALDPGRGSGAPGWEGRERSPEDTAPPGSHRPQPGPPAGPAEGLAARAGGPRPRRAHTPARRPLDLPLGVFEESPEAAAFLVKVPGVHLVVDGYNVALTSWAPGVQADPAARPPVTDLPGLRGRLLDALSELAVRVQRAVTVVFDGQDGGGRMSARGPARPWLRIVFSASSVEADEVIIEAVRRLRPEVPVVVATNDREVRDDARRLGANVISVDQLLGVLNRHTSM